MCQHIFFASSTSYIWHLGTAKLGRRRDIPGSANQAIYCVLTLTISRLPAPHVHASQHLARGSSMPRNSSSLLLVYQTSSLPIRCWPRCGSLDIRMQDAQCKLSYNHTHLLPLASLPARRPVQQYSHVLSHCLQHASKHQKWPTQHLELLLAVALTDVDLLVFKLALVES